MEAEDTLRVVIRAVAVIPVEAIRAAVVIQEAVIPVEAIIQDRVLRVSFIQTAELQASRSSQCL